MRPVVAKLKIKNGEEYFQTLEGHAIDCLKILKAYIKQNYDIITQFCKRWDLNREKFLKNLFLIVYLHDIGKLTKEFQENIRQNRRSHKYPHPYFGMFLLHESFTDTILEVPLELAAILGHHTQLYGQLYSDYNQFKKPTFLEDEIHDFVDKAKKVYRKLGFSEFFKFDGLKITVPEFGWKKIDKVRRNIIIRTNTFLEENGNFEKVRSVFTYIFAILQTCDDYASEHFSRVVDNNDIHEKILGGVLENPEKYVPKLEIEDPLKTILEDKTPYDFQKELLNPYKFVTLFAPCGRGKTEAALLWAVNALKKYKRNKIVFAMPTQTTSNAMYDRLKAIFGDENVGLYHGRSFIKLREEIKEEQEEYDEERDVEEIRSETFKGNIFFKPVTITTVDHLIYSFVKGFSQADFALGNLQNAVIIFDEVHYYEKLTLEHLITLFSLLRKMDIPHMLMSGTLPNFMLNKLQGYKHVEDREGLSFRPFKIEFNQEILSDKVVEELVEGYQKGITQFAILNTVERAKRLYLKLKEKLGDQSNVMLYHSQFTYSDRVKKENEIYQRVKQKPLILVATQVIEISLDISCDIMYSELAPPDAIGQRAGRLNRKGKNWQNGIEHRMKIYLPENPLPYDENLLIKTQNVIKKYQRPVSYMEIKELCDSVYDYELNEKSDLLYYFEKSTIFGEHWTKIATEDEEGLRFKVRDEKIQYVDVIPETLYLENGKDALKVENMAKIPLYYLLEDLKNATGWFYTEKSPKGIRKKTYWICRYHYSYETGFDYNGKNEEKVYIL